MHLLNSFTNIQILTQKTSINHLTFNINSILCEGINNELALIV